MSIWSDAVKIAYPGSVQKSDGAPFTRPNGHAIGSFTMRDITGKIWTEIDFILILLRKLRKI